MEDQRHEVVKLKEAMERLLKNEDFKLVFEEHFIRAFAITTAYNFAYFDQEQRRRSVENMAARSVFTIFVEDVLKEGAAADESLREDEEYNIGSED